MNTTPRGVANSIIAALERAGVDTSQWWGAFATGIQNWMSAYREYEAELLADLSSLADPASDSNEKGTWSLTDLGDLLTATGYQDVGVREFDRAFVQDSAETRRAWLDAMADAYGVDKPAVASQSRYLEEVSRNIGDIRTVSDDWFVASTRPLVEPSLVPGLDIALSVEQKQVLLSCLEAQSDWIACAAANVVASFDQPEWDCNELVEKDMSNWPRWRAGLVFSVAILSAGDERELLLGRAASSASADHRYAARITVSAASHLDAGWPSA